ncbi:hypothetical protein [Cryptosporangium minutisporangium]|uniref:Uncharacterized protein n=1 Tax=Cryptosporangium minutisporangium TaxID=113569 RepID=A0ABP6SW81_9ACTN
MRLKLGVVVGAFTVLALAGGGSAAWASDGGGPTHNRSSEPGKASLVAVTEGGEAPFTQEKAEQFAKCMRANGLPGFETPKVNPPRGDEPGRVESILPKDVDPETARKATEKCAPAAPAKPKLSASEVKKLKRYAQCMRENGVENFPTPRADGSLRLPEGIDPKGSEFQAAEEACEKYAPARRSKRVHSSSGGETVRHAGVPSNA